MRGNTWIGFVEQVVAICQRRQQASSDDGYYADSSQTMRVYFLQQYGDECQKQDNQYGEGRE